MQRTVRAPLLVRRRDVRNKYGKRTTREFRECCDSGEAERGTPRSTSHHPPTDYQPAYGKIFPGFRIPAGSNAAFTRFMSAI